MNRAEKYVYKVCQTKSFSTAAKELYVSQPSLSITIKKLESELGYEIFNRKNSPITLTREGELYIEYLEETIQMEKALKERISFLHESSFRTLSIGGYNSASFSILPKICGEFNRHFPNVTLKIDVGENIFDNLCQGSIDLAIHTDCDFSKFNAVKLWEEKYIVVVRKDYPNVEELSKYALSHEQALSETFPENKAIKNFDLFKDIKFFKPGPTSNAWKKMPYIMEQCNNSACRVINFHKMDTCYKLMLEGMGAIITPQSTLLENSHKKDNLYFFGIDDPNNVRQVMIIYKKDMQLSKASSDFIEIARNICSKRENLFKN